MSPIGNDQIMGFSPSFVRGLISILDGESGLFTKYSEEELNWMIMDTNCSNQWKGSPEHKIAIEFLAKQLNRK